jgi:hypothetical protein
MTTEFKPSDDLTSVIIPLMRATYTNSSKKMIQIANLYGTAFLIGKQGYALTAGHVIDQLFDGLDTEKEAVITHIHNVYGVFIFSIINAEKHPKQDVGLIKLNYEGFDSWLQIEPSKQNSSAEYHGWRYPIETAKEKAKLVEDHPPSPSLIFTKGYIRRTINREIYPTIIYSGNAYYEVSELGGGGYSGAPIINIQTVGRSKWKIIGVYVGEKSEAPSVGYVIRSDSFYDWIPEILGCSILDESLK